MPGTNYTQLHVTPLEEKLFEGSGVLRENPDRASPSSLSEAAVDLFVLIASAGSEGLRISVLPKRLKNGWENLALELELHNLAQRSRNTKGKIAWLTLTWQGEEVFEQARENDRQVAYRLRAGGWRERLKSNVLKSLMSGQENASVPEWKEALSAPGQKTKSRPFPKAWS